VGQAVNSRVPFVLVVEDEILIAEMVRDILTEYGFAVDAVSNAADALRYLSGDQPVDVMFTDINLPGDMDGAVLAQKARAMRPDLPVVFASGRWGLLDALRTFPNSVILQKPYSLTRACEAVAGLLKTAAPSNAWAQA
jgi:two-component system, response regulator PdtaR